MANEKDLSQVMGRVGELIKRLEDTRLTGVLKEFVYPGDPCFRVCKHVGRLRICSTYPADVEPKPVVDDIMEVRIRFANIAAAFMDAYEAKVQQRIQQLTIDAKEAVSAIEQALTRNEVKEQPK